MMKNFKLSTDNLSKEDNFRIWNNIYQENPEIYLELQLAKFRAEKAYIELVNYLEDLKGKGGYTTSDIDELTSEAPKERLLDYWEQAGLPGTASEFFASYVSENTHKLGLKNEADYDPKLPPMSYKDENGNMVKGNSREARNNLLLRLIQARMSDKATIKDRITPGSFAKASAAARLMRELEYNDVTKHYNARTRTVNIDAVKAQIEQAGKDSDPEPNYDPSDISTLLYFNKQNQIAAKVIGIAANQNSNHAYLSIAKSCKIKTPIKFGYHVESGLDNFIHPENQSEIDSNVAEFLAAAVDAVKDPVLNYLNINIYTAAMGVMLARLGYSTEEIGLLFTQPIILDICKEASKTGCNIQTAIKRICKRWYKKAANDPTKREIKDEDIAPNVAELMQDVDSKIAESSKLAGNKVAFKENKDATADLNLVKEQIQIASIFSNIAAVSSELNDFIAVTKYTASNSVGSTAGHFYNQQMRLHEYIEKALSDDALIDIEISDSQKLPIDDSQELLDMSLIDYMLKMSLNRFAFEQLMFDSNRKIIKKISESKYFPYESRLFKEVRRIVAENSTMGVLPAKLIDRLHEDLHVFCLMSISNSIFTREVKGLIVTTKYYNAKDYYEEAFAIDLKQWLEKKENEKYKSMPIFSSLRIAQDAKGKYYISMTASESGERIEDNIITNSWAEAYANPELKEITERLFIYNFLKTGFTFSPLSFTHLVPSIIPSSMMIGIMGDPITGEQKNVSYADVLEALNSGDSGIIGDDVLNDFLDQFMANHADDYGLIPTITSTEQKEVLEEKMFEDRKQLKQITITNDDLLNTFTDTIQKATNKKDDNGKRIYVPVKYFTVKLNGITYLYSLSEKDSIYGGDLTPKLVYNAVEIKGKTNSRVSYQPTGNQAYQRPTTFDYSDTDGNIVDETNGTTDDTPDGNDIPTFEEFSRTKRGGIVFRLRKSGIPSSEVAAQAEQELRAMYEEIQNSKDPVMFVDENGEKKPSCGKP